RALQERMLRPVGGEKEVPWKARVVAATNRDLDTLVARGEFREDLYYRLNVIRVDVPPLRQRREDIALCAQFFLQSFAQSLGKSVVGFSPAALDDMMAYSWPGNLRELQNCVHRAVALSNFDHVRVQDLPERVRRPASAEPATPAIEIARESLAEHERRYILKVLSDAHGNKAEAARILGIERRTLYRKLAEYELAGARDAE
ncbi:MAG TPA: sigma 54-interacting transcriptional regulator, partial [Polyangiaceae bacterium]|nr:sigma 54-interacting transcriptional regulator [Polyangiaceae bacterium]